MKRLEHIRTMRNQTSRSQAKTPHGAMMVLAQIAQEKQRLEQERGTWESRIQKIEKRLKEIAEMEQRLFAVALAGNGKASSKGAAANGLAGLATDLPPGFTEVTVKY
jgi:septal ring factor EnvC (AmiA/AmiB activator)